MFDNKDKVKCCVHPEDSWFNYGCMEENVKVNNVLSSKPTGLLKEIISEMDCRDKVRKYLDSLEIPDRFFTCMFGELVKIFGTALFEPTKTMSKRYLTKPPKKLMKIIPSEISQM